MFNGPMVMGLAQLVKSLEYQNALVTARARGKFVILDNGAAENDRVTDSRLVATANAVGPNELVLPDVMRDVQKTLDITKAFLRVHYSGSCSYMGVVQGITMQEAKMCIGEYFACGVITTLGLPRLLLDYNTTMRIDLANWIKAAYGNHFAIHLLGANSVWPREIMYAARYAPHIRSVDTSMPYNYAAAGKRLESSRSVSIRKPDDYFTSSWTDRLVPSLLDLNERTLVEWAQQDSQ